MTTIETQEDLEARKQQLLREQLAATNDADRKAIGDELEEVFRQLYNFRLTP